MISVFGSAVGEAEIREVASSIGAQWLGPGPKVGAFEHAFAERLGLPGFALTNSGSSSLELAVKALGLSPGTEIVLPAFTWVACAHAVVLNGCVPVFCDVDPDTQNVTAVTVAPHITPKTGAVMVVHYAGKPVDMAPILGLGLPVIEDAAHAVDSRWHGTACGAIGNVGIYSFDPVKNLATPDAGGVTARDAGVMATIRNLRYCGVDKSGFDAAGKQTRWWEHHIRTAAPKTVSNDIAAAIGLAQLRGLDRMQQRRRDIWTTYQQELGPLAWLRQPVDAAAHEQHSYFTYLVRIDAAEGTRDRLAHWLYDRGIYTTLRYQPLHLTSYYSTGTSLPVSETLTVAALNLPLHPRLSDDDVARVIDAISAFAP